MEQSDRDVILNNINALITNTNYDKLMVLCIDHQLIFEEMKIAIEEEDNEQIRHEKLLHKITQRGPTAYEIFTSILEETFPSAHEILINAKATANAENLNCIAEQDLFKSCWPFGASQSNNKSDDEDVYSEVNASSNAKSNKIMLMEYNKLIPAPAFTVIESNQIHYSPYTGTYRMESKHRGVAFIANMYNFDDKLPRRGAPKDRDYLITLFRQMGYTVFYYEDLKKSVFYALTNQLVKSSYLRLNESLIFCVMSHGYYKDGSLRVEFSDHETTSTDTIISQFNNFNCPNLAGKPKLFIFPFCRGDQHAFDIYHRKGVETDAREIHAAVELHSPPITPPLSDIKILYGTLPGYTAGRSTHDGSYYIRALCETWAARAHDVELDTLMKLTDERLRQLHFPNPYETQVSATEDRGFNRALYFNPGFVKPYPPPLRE